MKKIILGAFAFTTIITQAQNLLPENGNVGIGTTTPSAKLDVNGRAIIDSTLIVKDSVRFKDRLVVDKKAVFKQNAVVKGNMRMETNARVLNNMRVDNNLRVDGVANLNGNVKMVNIDSIVNINNPDLKILIKKPNGQIVTMTRGRLINLIYAQKPSCLSKEDNGPTLIDELNPIWNNGLNKTYSYYPCSNVNVGINTNNPQYKLDVRGITYSRKIKVGALNASQTASLNVFNPSNSQDIVNFGVNNNQTGQQTQVLFRIANNGTVILKSRNNANNFETYSSTGVNTVKIEDNGTVSIMPSGQNHPLIIYNNVGNKILQLKNNGLLRARSIKVDLDNWADYVFSKNYKMLSLQELAKFINENNHLPNVPTAKDIARDGLSLGDMQRIQMEKIEELTLYTIEQDKQIENLENTVDDLQKQLDEIKAMLK